jgi:hypothetical protein
MGQSVRGNVRRASIVALVAALAIACGVAHAEQKRRAEEVLALVRQGMTLDELLRDVVFRGSGAAGASLGACHRPASERGWITFGRQTLWWRGESRYSLRVFTSERDMPADSFYPDQDALLRAVREKAAGYSPCLEVSLTFGDWWFTVYVDQTEGVQGTSKLDSVD